MAVVEFIYDGCFQKLVEVNCLRLIVYTNSVFKLVIFFVFIDS